jgi:hypothetical protein
MRLGFSYAAQVGGRRASLVLITSGVSGLARDLARQPDISRRLTERTGMESSFGSCHAHSTAMSTRSLVRSVSAIHHVAEPLPGEDDRQQSMR